MSSKKISKNNQKKSTNNLIAILAIALVVFSVVNFAVVYNKTLKIKKLNKNLNQQLTGFATTAHGYVNLTISSNINIAMIDDNITWGTGYVNVGESNASLTTHGFGTAEVQRGTWSTTGVNAMMIENNGNVNCTLTLQTANNASDLFASETDSNQLYQINVSQPSGNSSCAGTGDITLGSWFDSDKTSKDVCGNNLFGSVPGHNRLIIDVKLHVPEDADQTKLGNDISDIITFDCS